MLTNANIVAGSPAYDWGYHTDDAPRLGHNIAVPQGRVIGGSSAVDAAVAMRARPADFARWAKRGIEGWSWDEARAPLAGPAMSPQRGRKQRQPGRLLD